MRLVLKREDHVINEFKFSKGPIYIGRHANSQIFLPDRIVSRHHAVIFCAQNGKWLVEDLDSANKTYLNNKPIHQAEIKTGDTLKMCDFTIKVNLEDEIKTEDAIHLEDTMQATAFGMEDTVTGAPRDLQTITRRPEAEHAPNIKLPAKRAKDFIIATEAICKARNIENTLVALLNIVTKQFATLNAWCALRDQTTGPMIYSKGKKLDGKSVKIDQLILNEKISEAIKEGHFLLFPQVPIQMIRDEKIRSVMIAPIANLNGCFGVLYLENSASHESYTLSDLDYLMLLAVHTAVVLENY